MKRLSIILAVAAVAAIALSCSKNEAPVKMKTISVEMGAPQAAADSKTVLVDNSHVYWTAFDKNIICFTDNSEDKSKGYGLSSTETESVPVKSFSGSIPEGDTPLFYIFDRNRTQSGNFSFRKGSATYLAVFVDPNQLMTLGTSGNFVANSFHAGCNYAVALPDDASFKSVFGYMKWTNNGAAIKYIKIEPLVSSENIVGQIKISAQDGALSFTHAWDSGTNYIQSGVAANADNSLITPDNSYYAIVYPRTYNGLKITITLAGASGTGTGSSFTIKTNQTFTVERGKYVDLGVLPIEPISKDSGTVSSGSGDFTEGWTME